METLGYYNGTYGPLDEMTVPMNDRACYFGDGVYDATYSRNYKIFALEEHVDRFFSSAALVEICLPVTKEGLGALLYEMLGKVDTGGNFVYWQATRGTGMRSHAFPEEGGANLWITIRPRQVQTPDKKVRLITLEDTRYLHCNIKTLNLLPNCVASERAKQAGADEVIFHRAGRVTECAHHNCHIIKGGVLVTAPTDNLILPGVTRAHLIRACGVLDIPVEERPYMVEDVFAADEVLISSVSSLGLAAETVDDTPVGGKAPELLARLQAYLWREFMEETI